MRIKEGYELVTICGEAIVVAHGLENINVSTIINLNESGAYLWHAVEGKDFDAAELARLLCQEYEVDEETVRRDVKAFFEMAGKYELVLK
jgi:hypothetical protein